MVPLQLGRKSWIISKESITWSPKPKVMPLRNTICCTAANRDIPEYLNTPLSRDESRELDVNERGPSKNLKNTRSRPVVLLQHGQKHIFNGLARRVVDDDHSSLMKKKKKQRGVFEIHDNGTVSIGNSQSIYSIHSNVMTPGISALTNTDSGYSVPRCKSRKRARSSGDLERKMDRHSKSKSTKSHRCTSSRSTRSTSARSTETAGNTKSSKSQNTKLSKTRKSMKKESDVNLLNFPSNDTDGTMIRVKRPQERIHRRNVRIIRKRTETVHVPIAITVNATTNRLAAKRRTFQNRPPMLQRLEPSLTTLSEFTSLDEDTHPTPRKSSVDSCDCEYEEYMGTEYGLSTNAVYGTEEYLITDGMITDGMVTGESTASVNGTHGSNLYSHSFPKHQAAHQVDSETRTSGLCDMTWSETIATEDFIQLFDIDEYDGKYKLAALMQQAYERGLNKGYDVYSRVCTANMITKVTY